MIKDRVTIPEDTFDQDITPELRTSMMTEEELKRAEYYINKYEDRKADIDSRDETWQEIENLYIGNRESEYDSDVNAYVNMILPNIEGQVSSMTSANISASTKGVGVSDQKFGKTAGVVVDAIMKYNRIGQRIKSAGRRYLKLGTTCCTVSWDPDAFDGMGMPIINTPHITKVLVDGKIHDLEDKERADFIIEEVGSMSIDWARNEFGDELANAIQLGNSEPEFRARYSTDDDDAFTYLRVWTKINEHRNLQLIEMSLCGIILRASDPSVPYWKYVHNKYPIFFAGLYPQEGEFYRFGDGQALKPVQELINKLYDEIVLAIKFSSQGRTYIDPMAKVNPDEFAEANPRKPIYASNPNQFINTQRGVGINDVVFRLLEQLFVKVQEITRFSSLMTGNDVGAGRMTATQAGIQMQQGVTGIDDKRKDISLMFSDALKYALGLCMENWSAAIAFRVAEDKEDFAWVDVREWTNIPELVPVTTEYLEEWRAKNPKNRKKPKHMALSVETDEVDEAGNKKRVPATKQLDLDVDLTLGEGMPNNKMAMYNIILSLAQLQLIDEMTGQPRSLLSYQKVLDMLENILGIKLTDEDVEKAKAEAEKMKALMPPPGQAVNPMTPGAGMVNMDANVPNANINGVAKGGLSSAVPR